MRAARLPLALSGLGALAGLALLLLGIPEPSALAGIAGLAVAHALFHAGERGRAGGRYATFALRIAVAMPLLLGFPLLSAPNPLVAALGFAWALGAVGVALGLFAPWAGLYAALAFPLALPVGGVPAYLALSLGALALAVTTDDTLSVDGWLRARRGGLFPTLRTEVVLEERPGR
jgi:hypothetical protein